MDTSGDSRSRLRAINGQVIATGQGCKSKKSCLEGVESVKKNAPNAEVVDSES